MRGLCVVFFTVLRSQPLCCRDRRETDRAPGEASGLTRENFPEKKVSKHHTGERQPHTTRKSGRRGTELKSKETELSGKRNETTEGQKSRCRSRFHGGVNPPESTQKLLPAVKNKK